MRDYCVVRISAFPSAGFMCDPKELHYFADDFACLQYVREEHEYYLFLTKIPKCDMYS